MPLKSSLRAAFLSCLALLTAHPADGAVPVEYPPHPLWPGPDPEEPPFACEMKFPEGVDASLWNANLWPGGVVPYVIDGAVTQQNSDRLRIAMNEVETVCNVSFVPRTSQPNYLYVQNGGGNNSFVGQIGGSQTVNLVSWSSRYIIIHELMHALGVWHEQNRADRDTYVIIYQGNVQAQYFSPNFTYQNGATPTGPYDFQSIMHYDRCSFSTCCPPASTCDCIASCRTIDVQPAFAQFGSVLGNRSFLSDGDKSGLASRYGGPVDDAFENNDSLGSAANLAVGSQSLKLIDADDYFSINLGAPGPIHLTFSAELWCSSNVTVSLLTHAGAVLASALPQDIDDNGTYEAALSAGSPTATVIVRVTKSQPWGGAYTLNSVAACVAQPWKQVVAGPGPSARTSQVMAFDSARGVAVMFGGDLTSSQFLNDTWEWNGSSWIDRSVSGPSARRHGMMAYDSGRQKTVLFGGTTSSLFRNDTHEWDGTAWTQKFPVTSPPARSVAGIAFDSARSRLVMFGGWNGSNELSDTWEYDGTEWHLRSTTGPSPRQWPAMTYDSVRQRTVLFGGSNGATSFGDTWEWNGATGIWTLTTDTGPSPRVNKNLAFDPVRGVCVMIGGFAVGNYFADHWEYNGTTWVRVDVQVPQGRLSHSTVWDSARQMVLMFGGEAPGMPVIDQLWGFKSSQQSWLPLAGPQQPPARGRFSMVGDGRLGSAILFGGNNAADTQVLGDTWVNHRGVWGRYADGNIITPRNNFAVAYDPIRERTVLYGGETFTTVHASTFTFGPAGWEQPAPVNNPGQRIAPGMSFDAARGNIVMFGGTDRTNFPTSTWTWDGVNWTQAASAGPSGRWMVPMAYDPVSQKVVLFGGSDPPGNPLGDTWTWDGTNWAQIIAAPPNAPTPRHAARMVFDPDRGRVVLHGGNASGTNLSDTWEFIGTGWRKISEGGPAPRSHFGFWRDPISNGIMLFGGLQSPNTFNDTWRFDSVLDPPAFTAQPQNLTIDAAQNAVFDAPASDAGPFTYRWFATTNNAGTQGSVALNDGDRNFRVVGVLTSQLQILNAQPSDATTQPVPGVFVNRYFCVVSNACQSATSTQASLTVNAPPPACLGDFNADTLRNTIDLTILLGGFGQSVPPGTQGDLDSNGIVNTTDLVAFLSVFGVPCP